MGDTLIVEPFSAGQAPGGPSPAAKITRLGGDPMQEPAVGRVSPPYGTTSPTPASATTSNSAL